MKLIHCADLHLDSPMETHMSREQAAKRNVEILKTFCRLTEYAAQNAVQLVLIAGDLFDGARVRARTVDTVLDAMKKTPSVTYLYVPGNHDGAAAAFADRNLPQNFVQFTDTWQTFRAENLVVSSIHMTPQNAESLYETLPEAPENCCNIVMLHGQTGTVSGVDCVNLNQLKGKGIDYLALGHLHRYAEQPLDENGVYCYCGCLEGRGFDECGDKGFVLLETKGKRIKAKFKPFASRMLHRVSVDITGAENEAEVYQKMKQEAEKEGIPSSDMVEFLLKGNADPSVPLSAAYLTQLAADQFFFEKVKDESRLAIRAETYQNDISLKGEFIRLVLSSEESEEEKARLIRIGLEALSGEEISL